MGFQGDYSGAARPFHLLNFPDTLSSIAAILLEYPHASRSKPHWKVLTKFNGRTIKVRIGAPAEMFRAVQAAGGRANFRRA